MTVTLRQLLAGEWPPMAHAVRGQISGGVRQRRQPRACGAVATDMYFVHESSTAGRGHMEQAGAVR